MPLIVEDPSTLIGRRILWTVDETMGTVERAGSDQGEPFLVIRWDWAPRGDSLVFSDEWHEYAIERYHGSYKG